MGNEFNRPRWTVVAMSLAMSWLTLFRIALLGTCTFAFNSHAAFTAPSRARTRLPTLGAISYSSQPAYTQADLLTDGGVAGAAFSPRTQSVRHLAVVTRPKRIDTGHNGREA